MHLAPEHLVRHTERNDTEVFLLTERRTERSQTVESQDLNLRIELHQALAGAVVADAAVLDGRRNHRAVLLLEASVAGGCAHAALECERRVGDLPAVVDAADDVVFRAARISEEHFAEFGGAVRLRDAAHFDTRLAHRHQ